MTKSLFDISLKITEEEYRNDPSLSYSIISSYDRGGFASIPHLFDKKESQSLTFGSCVDAIITGGFEEFNNRFVVLDNINVSDTISNICNDIYNNEKIISFEDISDDLIIKYLNDNNYCRNFKDATRLDRFKSAAINFYNTLHSCEGKTIIDSETYTNVINSVNALKESDATKFYFEDNNPFDNNIERFYQLKFKENIDGVDYKMMMDECIVIHDKKIIIPIDLKTSSKEEYNFYKSFIDWNYSQQAREYAGILKRILSRDEYFKDFTILNYRFIVVNYKTLIPLVWEYKDTFKTGTLFYGKNNQIECRDPFEVGKELDFILKNNIVVPNEIEINGNNDIIYWLNKY